VIRQFHDAGVYHDDLNAHNILLAEDMIYLIDFDKGDIRQGKSWKKKNLARLLRSLHKEQGKASQVQKTFAFSNQNWEQLLKGYEDKRLS